MEELKEIREIVREGIKNFEKDGAKVTEMYNIFNVYIEEQNDEEIYKILSTIEIRRDQLYLRRIENMAYNRQKIDELGILPAGGRSMRVYRYIRDGYNFRFEKEIPFTSMFEIFKDFIVLKITNVLRLPYSEFEGLSVDVKKDILRDMVADFIESDRRPLSEKNLIKLITNVMKVDAYVEIRYSNYIAWKELENLKVVIIYPYYP